jgi:UDPglucose--hexose-1-phosphate uridylyltransferase
VRYTQAIINHGREAGASLAHPHGQLLGLPFVPGEILEEQRAFTRFEGGCILCATVEAELVDGKRVVFATDDVVCVSPFWAGTPYELLIIPRSHDLHLTDSDDLTLRAVGVAIRDSLVALREATATCRTTWCSTRRRTTTTARSTGTCTCSRSWSPPPGSSVARAC